MSVQKTVQNITTAAESRRIKRNLILFGVFELLQKQIGCLIKRDKPSNPLSYIWSMDLFVREVVILFCIFTLAKSYILDIKTIFQRAFFFIPYTI